MKVLITGATGFIGKKLVHTLSREGHEIVILSRNANKAKSTFSLPVETFTWKTEELPPLEALTGVDAIVHLAGEGIAEKRWSEKQKKKIYDSRIVGTRNLLKAVQKVQSPQLKTLVSASAIGFYGDRGEEELNESSKRGTGFLADVCADWEKASQENNGNLRVVNLRTGIVLGNGGGMLSKLLPLFKLGLGGPVGNGKQWMSWIHVEDHVALIRAMLLSDSYSGPVNGVSPQPVTNAEFTKAMGHALSRPAILPAPAIAIKLAMGELSTLVLGSQKVLPVAAQKKGFTFQYPTIDEALEAIVKENPKRENPRNAYA